MKCCLLTVAAFFFLMIMPGASLVAQQPGQAPTDEKCDAPVYTAKEVDKRLRILAKPEPNFSALDRRVYARQTIVLAAMFCGSGEIIQIRVKKGVSDRLDARAIEAVKKIRFTPAEKDGEKVSRALMLEYRISVAR